jgi:sulfoxide reductase heme-binding subunit YedZ
MRLFRDHATASKALLFAACLVPLAWLTWDALHDGLGADPVAALEHRSGDWALRMLLATLAITPLRRLTGRTELVRFRRMLGCSRFSTPARI